MEESDHSDEIDQNEDCFFDALDEFPFHNCSDTAQSHQSTSDTTLCESLLEVSSPATTLLFRSSSGRGISPAGSKLFNPVSSCISSDITPTHSSNARYKEKKYKLYRDLKENEKNLDASELTRWNQDGVDSVGVTNRVSEDDKKIESMANVGRVDDSVAADELGDSSSANLFVFIAGLVIKAIGFQINLLVNMVLFPIWVLYNSYMLAVDPFGVMRRGRGFFLRKLVGLWNLISGFMSPFVFDWLKDQQSIWKLLLRFGYATFWAFYVCIVLCGLLVSSIMASGFFMRYLVENPIEMKNKLNFDYTQNSPVAFVPVMSCCGVSGGVNCEEKSLGRRIIPPHHKLRATVQLTLPESGYNRHLGIFQVRVDFLSADGKTLASKRQPCMLKFKSEPIRILLTFFKVAPLITGFMSETQTLTLKIRGITEGDLPTSCLKVVIEQRAEYQPGAGIPEIYDASLILESELPLFKSIIWCWKKTIFVWTSMMLFIIELLLTVICCRPVIIPRTRRRDVPSVINSTLYNLTEIS